MDPFRPKTRTRDRSHAVIEDSGRHDRFADGDDGTIPATRSFNDSFVRTWLSSPLFFAAMTILISLSLMVGYFIGSKRPTFAFESAGIAFLILVVVFASAIGYGRMNRTRRRAYSALRFGASHDHLTGLMNRRGFLNLGRELLHGLEQQGNDAGILLLDVDNFKSINERLGQQAGDEFLQQLSSVLSRTIRSTDLIGRLGGNEFGFFLPCADPATSFEIAEALRGTVTTLASATSPGNFIGASLGISALKGSGFHDQSCGSRLEDLLSQADLALSVAKSEGGNRTRVYQPDDASKIAENHEIEHALARALEHNELYLAYQPLMNLATDRLVGVEALARWQHPKLGLIPPDKFIPRAEATGLIHSIGAWALDSACRQLKHWERAGYADLTMSVNVSPIQLKQPGFARIVSETLSRNDLLPHKLVLEITESVMMKSGGAVPESLRELAEMEVRTAIDDFGTGYSSLSYLRLLRCDFLKIDRSFVSDIPNNKDAVTIAKGVIGMGRSLGLRIVAEGIETQEQAEFLRGLWCEEGQGYFYARPMKARDFESWAMTRSALEGCSRGQEAAREIA